MRQVEREISRAHPAYSACMADLYEFVNKHGANARTKILERTNDRPRVETCIEVTKEYWRSVQYWSSDYDAFKDDPNNKTVYQKRYNRFVPLVKPLDFSVDMEDDWVYRIKEFV